MTNKGDEMKKITIILMFLFLSGMVSADTTRTQKISQVTQAIEALQGGSVWRARVEEQANGLNLYNLFVQYPGNYASLSDGNRDTYVKNGAAKVYQGSSVVNEYKFSELPEWILFSGKIGKNVQIEMVDSEMINLYGETRKIVVADLLGKPGKGKIRRLRAYVSVDGTPKLLGYGIATRSGFSQVWFRDLHQVTPKKSPFERSVL